MLNGSQLGSQILQQLKSKGLNGETLPNFSMALGEGIVTSFKATNTVSTVDIGVIVVGLGKGKMSGIEEKILLGLTMSKLAAAQVKGQAIQNMAQGICTAVTQHFLLMNTVDTSHVGVAVGTGVGKVSGLQPDAMTSMVMGKMRQKNIKGDQLMSLVKAVCSAFCEHVMSSGIANVVIAGIPILVLGVPIPGAGGGMGKVS